MANFLGYAKADTVAIANTWQGTVTQYTDRPGAGTTNDELNYPDRARALNCTRIRAHPGGVITQVIFKITGRVPNGRRPDLPVFPGIDNELYSMAQMISEGWFLDE